MNNTPPRCDLIEGYNGPSPVQHPAPTSQLEHQSAPAQSDRGANGPVPVSDIRPTAPPPPPPIKK
jgi:hypothetical protein